MTDWRTRSAQDILEDISRMIEHLRENKEIHPPVHYFIRESDDADPEWRKKMEEQGWVRRYRDNGMCLATWVKGWLEPVGVLADVCFPEDKDGKRVEMMSIRKSDLDPPLPEYVPLEVKNV